MGDVKWQEFCKTLGEYEGEWKDISVQLSCGLKIEGRIHCSDAANLFREPDTMKPIDRRLAEGNSTVVMVLPTSKILSIAYPAQIQK